MCGVPRYVVDLIGVRAAIQRGQARFELVIKSVFVGHRCGGREGAGVEGKWSMQVIGRETTLKNTYTDLLVCVPYTSHLVEPNSRYTLPVAAPSDVRHATCLPSEPVVARLEGGERGGLVVARGFT